MFHKTCQRRSLDHIQGFTEKFKYFSDCHGTSSNLAFKIVTRLRDGYFQKGITYTLKRNLSSRGGYLFSSLYTWISSFTLLNGDDFFLHYSEYILIKSILWKTIIVIFKLMINLKFGKENVMYIK